MVTLSQCNDAKQVDGLESLTIERDVDNPAFIFILQHSKTTKVLIDIFDQNF